MRAGTIQRTRVIGVRLDSNVQTHDFRVRYLTTEHGHAARHRCAGATRVYQSDSSSKRPASSAFSGCRNRQPERERPPPEKKTALTWVTPYHRNSAFTDPADFTSFATLLWQTKSRPNSPPPGAVGARRASTAR